MRLFAFVMYECWCYHDREHPFKTNVKLEELHLLYTVPNEGLIRGMSEIPFRSSWNIQGHVELRPVPFLPSVLPPCLLCPWHQCLPGGQVHTLMIITYETLSTLWDTFMVNVIIPSKQNSEEEMNELLISLDSGSYTSSGANLLIERTRGAIKSSPKTTFHKHRKQNLFCSLCSCYLDSASKTESLFACKWDKG